MAQDANYNVTTLFDNSGNVVERYVYDPFGQVTVLAPEWNVLASSVFGWLHLHQGGRFDATSGLYHFRFRDYSPTLGRWTSLDPLRYDAGDVNLYRALGNGPVIWLDPSGLDRIDRTQAGNQTLLWYVDEKFIGSDKKFLVGVLVTINGEQFARRYVGGQPLYVPLAKVNSTTGFWESTPSNWDQWFRDNAASVNEPSIKNLQMQEGISRSNWNDLATGQKQIQGLAETAIYWNAGAGFNATPTAAANRAVAATRAPTSNIPTGPAHNAANYARLREFYRQAEQYGQGGYRVLENGRYRFYGELMPARTAGEMQGARLVREWDPVTGNTRTWYETLDHAGRVRSVAPKPPTGPLNHRIFDADGKYQGLR